MIAGVAITGAVPTGSTGLEEMGLGLSAQKGIGAHTAGLEFTDLFRDTIGNVTELEQQARQTVEGMMRGTGVDIHQALIAAEKANAAFELTLSIRNKAVQSYQSIMSMQF